MDLEALIASRLYGYELIIIPCLNLTQNQISSVQSIQGHICPNECDDIVTSNQQPVVSDVPISLLPCLFSKNVTQLASLGPPSSIKDLRSISLEDSSQESSNEGHTPPWGPNNVEALKTMENFNILLNSSYHFTTVVGC